MGEELAWWSCSYGCEATKVGKDGWVVDRRELELVRATGLTDHCDAVKLASPFDVSNLQVVVSEKSKSPVRARHRPKVPPASAPAARKLDFFCATAAGVAPSAQRILPTTPTKLTVSDRLMAFTPRGGRGGGDRGRGGMRGGGFGGRGG